MPIQVCTVGNKPGFRYGASGFCYTYKAGSESGRAIAKRKAILQGAAIAQSTGEKLVVKDKLTFTMKKEKTTYDDENNLIFGWGYVAIEKDGKQVTDHSEEFVDEETLKDLEIATYGFNIGSRKSGFGHKGLAKGYLAESMFFTKEKLEVLGLSEDALPQGAWLGVWFPNNEDYAKIKKMKSPMFSMEGSAIKEEV